MNKQLPATIQCYECQQNLTRQRFAPSNLEQWQNRLRDQHRQGKHKKIKGPVCVACTPQTTVEKECGRCSETKGIDEFSGRQRAMDNGFCINCTNEISNLNVNGSIERGLEQQYACTEYGSENGSHWQNVSHTSTRPSMGTLISDSTQTISNHFQSSTPDSGDAWINPDHSSEHASYPSKSEELPEITGTSYPNSSATGTPSQSVTDSGARLNTSYSSWSDFPSMPGSNLSTQNHSFSSRGRGKRF